MSTPTKEDANWSEGPAVGKTGFLRSGLETLNPRVCKGQMRSLTVYEADAVLAHVSHLERSLAEKDEKIAEVSGDWNEVVETNRGLHKRIQELERERDELKGKLTLTGERPTLQFGQGCRHDSHTLYGPGNGPPPWEQFKLSTPTPEASEIAIENRLSHLEARDRLVGVEVADQQKRLDDLAARVEKLENHSGFWNLEKTQRLDDLVSRVEAMRANSEVYHAEHMKRWGQLDDLCQKLRAALAVVLYYFGIQSVYPGCHYVVPMMAPTRQRGITQEEARAIKEIVGEFDER